VRGAFHLGRARGAPSVPHSPSRGCTPPIIPTKIADTPRGRVSSLRPPAHDIRRPPRDQCTRTSCSSSSSSNGSSSGRECVQTSRASSSTSTHATANGVAGSRGTWASINSRRRKKQVRPRTECSFRCPEIASRRAALTFRKITPRESQQNVTEVEVRSLIIREEIITRSQSDFLRDSGILPR